MSDPVSFRKVMVAWGKGERAGSSVAYTDGKGLYENGEVVGVRFNEQYYLKATTYASGVLARFYTDELPLPVNFLTKAEWEETLGYYVVGEGPEGPDSLGTTEEESPLFTDFDPEAGF